MKQVQIYGFTVYEDGRVINTRTGKPCIVSCTGHVKATYNGQKIVRIKERLIYDAFAPEGEKLSSSYSVLFKDGDKTNFAFDNLIRVHRYDLPFFSNMRLFSSEQVVEIEAAFRAGETVQSLSERYKCSYDVLYKIKKGAYYGCQKQN